MKSRIIEVNGVEVTCYEDGSVEKIDGRSGKPIRMLGSTQTKGYKQLYLGGKTALIHRLMATAFLGGISKSEQVDHINGVRDDNRLENLRVLTHGRNCQAFKTPCAGASSIYRGVHWAKENQKWKAAVSIEMRKEHVGYFDCERDAAIARDTRAVALGFPVEGLNFPEMHR